jgi:hypothetical protein
MRIAVMPNLRQIKSRRGQLGKAAAASIRFAMRCDHTCEGLEEFGDCDKPQGDEKRLRHAICVLPQQIRYQMDIVDVEGCKPNDYGDSDAYKP